MAVGIWLKIYPSGRKNAVKSNAVMEYKIEELTREVRKHNGFAEKIPVIQRDIQVLNHRMTDIETHEHERS